MPSNLRDRLAAAAAQLKADGHDEHAAAVDAVLAPGGWRRVQAEPGTRPETSNLPVLVPKALRDRLQQTADDMDVSLGPLATEGFRALAEGRWEPPAPVRAKRGSMANIQQVNLNMSVENDAREQAAALLPGLSEKFGRKVSLAHVALSWLREELGVEDD